MVNWAILTQMSKSDISVKETASETNETQDREGRYADAFRIGHSAYKFVLDFGQFFSQKGKPNFHTRIIMGPDNAKAFIAVFEQSIREYKRKFGGIAQGDD